MGVRPGPESPSLRRVSLPGISSSPFGRSVRARKTRQLRWKRFAPLFGRAVFKEVMDEDESTTQMIWTSDGPRRRRSSDVAEPFVTYTCDLCGRRPERSPREHYGMHYENARTFLELATGRGDRQGQARARGWIEACRRVLPELREKAAVVGEDRPVDPLHADDPNQH